MRKSLRLKVVVDEKIAKDYKRVAQSAINIAITGLIIWEVRVRLDLVIYSEGISERFEIRKLFNFLVSERREK